MSPNTSKNILFTAVLIASMFSVSNLGIAGSTPTVRAFPCYTQTLESQDGYLNFFGSPQVKASTPTPIGCNPCETRIEPPPVEVLNYFDVKSFFGNIKVGASSPIPAYCNPGGGVITINSTQNSSSNISATISSSSITPKKDQASIISFNPSKLQNGKKLPVTGVLAGADDKLAIEDPYTCGGNVHGSVEYSGDYDNIIVSVTALNNLTNITYTLPVDFNKSSHLYEAKVNYKELTEADYKVTYSAINKNSKELLDKHSYPAFITQNCSKLQLARTGGAPNVVDLAYGAMMMVGFLGCISLIFSNKKAK